MRRNKRCVPGDLIYFGRKFPRWPDKPKQALWKLPKTCSFLAPQDKELTQRRVLYHLKFTLRAKDLVTSRQDQEEQKLFRKALIRFFASLRSSETLRCRVMLKLQSVVGVEIHCGMAMLRRGDIGYDSLNREARSLLFLIGHMPSFRDLFATVNPSYETAAV